MVPNALYSSLVDRQKHVRIYSYSKINIRSFKAKYIVITLYTLYVPHNLVFSIRRNFNIPFL